jgi:hypothetical protein
VSVTSPVVVQPTPVPAPSWLTVFDGYGWVHYGDAGRITMAPMASTRPDETHASLARTASVHGDLDLSLRMGTVRQLRTGTAPNPWEVAWGIWNYTDNVHFYYVILKPNGWELGKADPAYPGAQRFLATGETPYPIGPMYSVRVRQVGNTITVWAEGRQLVTFTDNERPYRSGNVAVYNEDAEVAFDSISITDL